MYPSLTLSCVVLHLPVPDPRPTPKNALMR